MSYEWEEEVPQPKPHRAMSVLTHRAVVYMGADPPLWECRTFDENGLMAIRRFAMLPYESTGDALSRYIASDKRDWAITNGEQYK